VLREARAVAASASAHRRGLRCPRAGRPRLHRHGVCRGDQPRRAHGARSAAARRSAPDRPATRVGAGRGARAGGHPPRSQAGQHPGDARRVDQGPRLRRRPDDAVGDGDGRHDAERGAAAHPPRQPGDADLHGARTAGRPRRGRAQRLVQRGRDPVSDGDRAPAVSGDDRGRTRAGDERQSRAVGAHDQRAGAAGAEAKRSPERCGAIRIIATNPRASWTPRSPRCPAPPR
jgi:hypothetical protein